MRAFLIDPAERRADVIDVQSWDQMKELIGADIMADLLLDEGQIEDLHNQPVRVSLFHDDDGMLKEDNAAFVYIHKERVVLAGKVVMAAYYIDDEGDMHFLDLGMPVEMLQFFFLFEGKTSSDYRIKTSSGTAPDGTFVVKQELEEVTDEDPEAR